MQKKMIALAVAGLVSGAAFAQSNVTLYGIVDLGYKYKMDYVGDNIDDSGAVDSGGLDGSRVGVKGEEDLGNGLKAGFDATWNFDSDRASEVKMGEGSSVYLGGNWGKVRAGYFGGFLDDNTGVDASGRHGPIHTGSLYDTGKYENFVAYYSPMFSGMQFKAGYSSNIGGADKDDLDSGALNNTRAYTTALSYANGPFKAGIAYAYYDAAVGDDYTGDDDNSSDWNAGVSYTFGQSTVSLFGAQQKKGAANIAQNVFLSESIYDKNTFWALGFNTYITPNDQIKVGYGQSKLEGVGAIDDETLTAWNLNYFHSLSKRSTLYAMYGNRDIEDIAAVKSAAKQSIDDKYQQMFMVGMRHTF